MIGPSLEEGESILKTLAAQPPGSISRGINETMSTGYGLVKGRREKKAHHAEAIGLAAAIPPQNVYLTLTDRRVLVHTHSKLGVPQKQVAQFTFDQLSSIRFDPGRFGSGKVVPSSTKPPLTS